MTISSDDGKEKPQTDGRTVAHQHTGADRIEITELLERVKGLYTSKDVEAAAAEVTRGFDSALAAVARVRDTVTEDLDGLARIIETCLVLNSGPTAAPTREAPTTPEPDPAWNPRLDKSYPWTYSTGNPATDAPGGQITTEQILEECGASREAWLAANVYKNSENADALLKHKNDLLSFWPAIEVRLKRLKAIERELAARTARPDECREALQELVRLKDLKDRIEKIKQNPDLYPEFTPATEEYKRCEPIAWEAARKVFR